MTTPIATGPGVAWCPPLNLDAGQNSGKQVVAEEFHQQAVMELAVGAALVLAHHADRAEADLRIAADRPLVGRRGVDGDPVVPAPAAQVPGEQADGLGADAAAL